MKKYFMLLIPIPFFSFLITACNKAEDPPLHPVAIAGSNLTITLPANSTLLDGTASFDPDGSVVAYKWSKLSGPGVISFDTPNSPTTRITGLREGTYEFKLTVVDNKGFGGTNTITIWVVFPELKNELIFENLSWNFWQDIGDPTGTFDETYLSATLSVNLVQNWAYRVFVKTVASATWVEAKPPVDGKEHRPFTYWVDINTPDSARITVWALDDPRSLPGTPASLKMNY